MTKDEALAFDLALEALEYAQYSDEFAVERGDKAITAIKQARLAQQEHEPENEPHVSLASVQDNDAHYKGVVEGVQKLFDDKRAQPAPVREDWGPGPHEHHSLPAPVQEPVAWTVSGKITDWSKDFSAYQTKHYTRPVYTPPAAQRQWVGLTDEEIEKACVPLGAAMLSFTEVARAIEAKLKEKNT